MNVERCASPEQRGWLELRQALWPQAGETHRAEMAAQVAEPARFAAFVAYQGRPVGFAEAAIRADYVNGAESSPVPFLEGLYVVPDARRKGVAAALVDAVASWAKAGGYRELASDARLGNEASHATHRALGFEETQRVVYFRKAL